VAEFAGGGEALRRTRPGNPAAGRRGGRILKPPDTEIMSRRRFHADKLDGQLAAVCGAGAVHLSRVLRARRGDEHEIAFEGRVYLGRIAKLGVRQVVFDLVEQLDTPSAATTTIVVGAAIFKFNRFDWLIEKATELGVARLQPLISFRTDTHLAQAALTRVKRWRNVAREAAEQSRAARIPDLAPPIKLRDFLAADTAAATASIEHPGDQPETRPQSPHALKLFFSEHPDTTPLQEWWKQARGVCGSPDASAPPGLVLLTFGPEGGWTEDEAADAGALGWSAVSLGPSILRSETAAIVGIANVLYELRRL
jgi:16S rRNA (uracil1498-N3)-methyltransferase